MRIAWFTHRYYPCLGGAETYSRAMIRRFVGQGHEVDVVTSDAFDLWYFTDPKRRRVTEPRVSQVDGATVQRFPVRHFPGQRYVGRLLSYLPHWPTRCRWESYMPFIPGIEHVRGDYDVVFAVGFPFTVFSYAAFRTARAASAPLIITPFLHLSTPGDRVHRHYSRRHQARLLREANLVISPTKHEATVVQAWGVPPHHSLVLPMAIEEKEVTGGDGAAYRARLGIAPDSPVIGQLGALDPNKGSTHLIGAVQRLNESSDRTEPVRLLLAGASSPDFEAFVATLPPDSKRWLTILGQLPNEDVPHFYDAISLFAMPSRTDSYGIVYLEAWANVKPVVAASAGGVVEVVKDRENGRLVPFGDVEGLARVLNELLTDRDQANRLAQAGHQTVRNGGNWDDRFRVLTNHIGWTIERQHRTRYARTIRVH